MGRLGLFPQGDLDFSRVWSSLKLISSSLPQHTPPRDHPSVPLQLWLLHWWSVFLWGHGWHFLLVIPQGPSNQLQHQDFVPPLSLSGFVSFSPLHLYPPAQVPNPGTLSSMLYLDPHGQSNRSNTYNKYCFILFWLHCIACRILVPSPGMEHMPLQYAHNVVQTSPLSSSRTFSSPLKKRSPSASSKHFSSPSLPLGPLRLPKLRPHQLSPEPSCS